MSRRGLSEDFESIFRDTEDNISSIKRSLDKGRNHYIPRSPVNVNSLSYGSPSPNKSFNKTNSGYSPQSSSQTTLITSMFKRLEEQSKTITVLEQMMQHQGKEIQRIKEKQNDYRNSFGENSSFDFHHKIETIERKLRGEIESIWMSIRSSNKLTEDNGFDKSARDDLSRDIKLQRRLIEDESESLRKEVDGLKSRIARIESDVNTSLRDALDVNRKYGEVEKDVSNIIASQRSLTGVTQRGENQLQEIKSELEQIGSMLNNVRSASPLKKNVQKKSNGDYMFSRNKSSTSKDNISYNIADSPTLTLLSNASDIDFSLDSSNSSDKGQITTDTRTDQLLNEHILRIELSDEDDDLLFLEKDGSNVSLDDLQLSDDISVLTDDLL